MAEKIELREVLDKLDTWIAQEKTLDRFEVSYREGTGAMVTLLVVRPALWVPSPAKETARG